jgi:hypothetical protein
MNRKNVNPTLSLTVSRVVFDQEDYFHKTN